MVGTPGSSAPASACDVHAALAVDGEDDLLLAADSEQAERAADRHVPLLADDDAKRRRPARPRSGRSHPRGVDALPRRGKAGDVRHLAAGHEGERRLRRQAEQLEHPAPRDRLERRRRRGRLGKAGVLVPGGDEPVGRERGGQRAADHEPEVAAGAHRGETGSPLARELLDDRDADRTGLPVAAGRTRPASRGSRARAARAASRALEIVGGELAVRSSSSRSVTPASLRAGTPPAGRAP